MRKQHNKESWGELIGAALFIVMTFAAMYFMLAANTLYQQEQHRTRRLPTIATTTRNTK